MHIESTADNHAMRDLFTLPQVQTSASTALTVPEMPTPKVVTGDREIDAVLWLQECVKTGHQVLIDKALEAAKKITTPMKELGLRYAQYLARQHGNTMLAALGSMGFGELESQAKGAIERQRKRHVALSRFGTEEALFADTPAEAACKKALRGLKCNKSTHYQYDDRLAAERFAKKVELRPFTLTDCLYGQAYWDELCALRAPFVCGDGAAYALAHDSFCFALMANLAPRSKDEALAVFEYMEERDATDRTEGPAILRNLIAGGWA
jgi:hypothetical protein